jgi:HSP20 family protein
VDDNALTIRGEKRAETEDQERGFSERTYGRFERTFWLPTTVDSEKIQATFKDGVLELRLPKSEAAKPKRIAITGA